MTMTMTAVAEHVRRDLAAFGDPGTLVEVADMNQPGQFRVTWSQDGRPRTATFATSDPNAAFPEEVVIGDGGPVSYRSFLSGSQMANLRALARNALNVIEGREHFIVPSASSTDAVTGNAIRDNADTLIDRFAVPGDGRTNVVFVAAEAGVGKTTLLRELIRGKAEQYLAGASEVLWLYVDAQGRRLAQLDEAVAAELDDLRARFPYHGISSLVRCGAVILAIDGFDELVGSVGSYEEAFGSLANFIAELDGHGCLVAAARSAYYEQEFLTRANSVRVLSNNGWVLRPIQLEDWTLEKREEFVRSVAESNGIRGQRLEEFAAEVDAVLDTSEVGDLGYKPLFVSRTVELIRDGLLLNGPSLLDRLIAAYIHRETTQKLLSPSTGAAMISDEDLRLLFSELAEEMWKQETRELSVGSTREVAELVGELVGLTGDALAEVVQRLPYAALLAQGSLPGSIAFEHDVFFSYFLAGPLTMAWQTLDVRTMTMLLRRGRLAEEAAFLAGRLARANQSPQDLLTVLSQSGATRPLDAAQVRRNAGGLAAALLQGTEESDLQLRQFDFTDVSFSRARLSNARFVDCTFAGTDLTETEFLSCSADNVTFDRVLVDPRSTRLELSGATPEDFYGISVRSEEGDRLLFSPQDILNALKNCGLPSAQSPVRVRAISPVTLKVLDRLCNLYTKTNALTETDDEMRQVVSAPVWPRVRSALLDSGVVTQETKPASGQKVFLHRRFRPQEIMRGLTIDADLPDAVRDLWARLEET